MAVKAVKVEPVAPATGDVYTMAEAARLKGVSYHTVSRAVRRGKLPAQRLGRMALISSEDLREWRPMRERAPRKYRRREPNPNAAPAMLDLSSGERVQIASQLATMYELLNSHAAGLERAEFLALVADRLAAALDLDETLILAVDGTSGSTLASYGGGKGAKKLNPAVRAAAAAEEPSIVDAAGAAFGDGEALVVPVRAGGASLGAIVGHARGEEIELSPDQRLLAQGVANLVALTMERAR